MYEKLRLVGERATICITTLVSCSNSVLIAFALVEDNAADEIVIFDQNTQPEYKVHSLVWLVSELTLVSLSLSNVLPALYYYNFHSIVFSQLY